MPYSKDELKSELLRCYENEEEVTTEILNSPDNDYPTQMTYYNYFGSLKNARESVGIISGHTKERVLSDIRKCYDKHNEVSTKVLDNDDELVDYSTVYQHFGGLSEAVTSAGLEWEDAKRVVTLDIENEYSRDELIQNLIDCNEEEGNTKTSTINNFDGPTSQAYRNRFGSISEARKIAGIEPSFKFARTNGQIDRLLEDIDYKNSDAVIYVLRMNVNGAKAYYVGESTSFKDRLNTHVYQTKVQSWAHSPHGKILAPRNKTNELNNIEIKSIEYVIPLNQKEDESDINFRRRRKYREHHEHLSVAMEKDTLDVYGGR